MKGLFHSSSVQYAVIKASSTERLVIAYRDKKSLCDLIAGPSIVGLGFASHEDAVASLDRVFPHATISIQTPRTTANHQFGLLPVTRTLAKAFSFSKSHRIARILQYAAATVIVSFYSRNIVATTIRMALGTSF
jgi:hypothetical protein